MEKVTQSKIISYITICCLLNFILLVLLYNIPISNNSLLENICIYKHITGKPCWNCGMTRAFLSIIHLNFEQALKYNKNCVFVFQLTMIIYSYSWIKFIYKKIK